MSARVSLDGSAIEPLGDCDSASAILSWADGRQMSISNSRRAVYGYDQRVEVHRSAGMAAAENEHPVGIEVATGTAMRAAASRFLHDPICRGLRQ